MGTILNNHNPYLFIASIIFCHLYYHIYVLLVSVTYLHWDRFISFYMSIIPLYFVYMYFLRYSFLSDLFGYFSSSILSHLFFTSVYYMLSSYPPLLCAQFQSLIFLFSFFYTIFFFITLFCILYQHLSLTFQ